MAFGRLEREGHASPMSEINMTPLIDVMLVLMIIFMITAPLLHTDLKLQLPKVDSKTSDSAPQALGITLDAAGLLYLNEQKTDELQLTQALTKAAQTNPDADVQLRCDEKIPYGRTAQIIALVQKAGITRIGLVTEVAQKNTSP
jgi:biopolymer transport protein TolR